MTTLARPQAAARPRDDGASIGALITGGTGAVFGFGGFVAVVIGDEMIALDATAFACAGLAVLALLGAILVRYIPAYGAIALASAPIGYLAALGGSWGAWWTTYEDAVATSGAAENIFWTAMPAMALFAISGALLAVGAALAAFSTLSRRAGG